MDISRFGKPINKDLNPAYWAAKCNPEILALECRGKKPEN